MGMGRTGPGSGSGTDENEAGVVMTSSQFSLFGILTSCI